MPVKSCIMVGMTSKMAFEIAGDKLKKSSFLVPIFLVTLALFICSIFLLYEDWHTSLWGYERLSTQPGFPFTGYIVASLPLLVQILAGYFAIALGFDGRKDTNKLAMYAFFILAAAFLVDVYTDVIYRVGEQQEVPVTWVEGVLQSIIIFTLGSEMAFTVSFGFLRVITFQALLDLGGMLDAGMIIVGKILGWTLVTTKRAIYWLFSIDQKRKPGPKPKQKPKTPQHPRPQNPSHPRPQPGQNLPHPRQQKDHRPQSGQNHPQQGRPDIRPIITDEKKGPGRLVQNLLGHKK